MPQRYSHLLLLVAVFSLSACTDKTFSGNYSKSFSMGSDSENNHSVQSINTTHVSDLKTIEPLMTSETFEKSGFKPDQKRQFEKAYGPYFGTFNGLAVFDLRVVEKDGNKAVRATVLSHRPCRKVKLSLQATSIKPAQICIFESVKEDSQPFTTMTANCPIKNQSIVAKDIRVVSIDVTY
jgi:hypothetical protein